MLLKSSAGAPRDFWWRCITDLENRLATKSMEAAQAGFAECRPNAETRRSIGEPGGEFTYHVLPIDADAYFTEIERLVAESEKVFVLAQFFESRKIMDMMGRYVTVDFVLLVDDAYAVAARTGRESNFIDQSEGRRLLSLARRHPNVELRFLQTNHDQHLHGGYRNEIHARSIHFEGASSLASMVGSAHFRDGAVRRNSEVQVFLYGEAARQHGDFFSSSWTGPSRSRRWPIDVPRFRRRSAHAVRFDLRRARYCWRDLRRKRGSSATWPATQDANSGLNCLGRKRGL